MKKTFITEGELIGRSRGLREYLAVLEAQFDPNVKALQDKLIAAGAKIKADGFMGPATRAAQAQFPNVTTQTDTEKAVGADINNANNTPASAPSPQTSMNTDDEAGTHAFDPTWGGTVATGGQTTAPNANATWNNASQTAVPNAPAAPAGWTPTPEQAKWLGNANQQDPNILNRMPGVKPPITHFTDPADQATAKRLGFPAAAAPAAAPTLTAKTAPPAAPGTAQTNPNALDKGEEVVPAKESVGYGDEQILARIVELSRR
jgi:hypothetical protein